MEQTFKRILVYFPYNQRTVEQQSVMEMLVNKGHTVHLITLSPENYLHTYVRTLGVHAVASPVPEGNSFKKILANARFLRKYCRQHRIDIILVHQQLCALPLIAAGPGLRSTNYYIRHNTDEDYKVGPAKAYLLNRFINTFCKNFIAPSEAVYNYLVNKEHVSPRKIRRINYGYNFNQYDKPVPAAVAAIKNRFNCRFLVLSIARLTAAKRHTMMFEAIQSMVAAGIDVKMVCLGGGPLKDELPAWIKEQQLDKHIFLEGIQPNVMDYLAASDLLMHLSETEASNSVVKEAGLAKKPVIVCERVGDFSDYIKDGQNGFLVNKEAPVPRVKELLLNYYTQTNELERLGANLYQTVMQEFDINNVAVKYDEILR
jgi:glycosyltransferase involved in cell wall biosynthesis